MAWRAWRWRARRIWAQARHIWRRGPQRRRFLSSSLLRERRWRGAAVEEDLATGRGDARGFGSANACPRVMASPFPNPGAALRAVLLQARKRPAEPRSPLPPVRASDVEP
ncbi:hypothetical protein OsI_27956 [Oryza sativa Indica Group]|uniref:Uncharacterized protein n=1 Tax=Oryza sativa subsp. indica TaxID=39946 RepID=A2YRL8_ORYSI|nr:hypothetical protein OsI_27956 [Oryza sativa Indica Group]